jgi:AcrR family transcriptional regulator
MSAARRGPRPAGTDTREAILEAARHQFGEVGYRRATLRAVAADAGVDPRLVLHYFGSKRQLFIESVRLPFEPEQLVAEVFADDGQPIAEHAVRTLLGALEDPETRQAAVAIIRAAASEPEAAEIIRHVLTEQALSPLTRRIGGDAPQLRASLIGSQFVGLIMARYVVGIEPLASAPLEQVVRAVTPVFDHYLFGPLVGPAGTAAAGPNGGAGRPRSRGAPTPDRPAPR